MLTLDETTLYYFSLSSSEPRGKGGVKEWASMVSTFAPPSKSKSTAGAASLGSQAPSLTSGSTRSSSKSALTDQIVVTMDQVDIVAGEADLQGGLADDGAERDEAALSPVKGKKRLNSKVIKSLPSM